MELVAIILVIAAVAAAEVLIFGKYALKGIYYSAVSYTHLTLPTIA